VEPERLDFITKWIFGADTFDNPRRDLCGLILTGVFVTVGAAATLIANGYFPLALLILFGGALKGLAYVIGWKYKERFEKPRFGVSSEATKVGELLTGLFAGVTIVLTLVALVGFPS